MTPTAKRKLLTPVSRYTWQFKSRICDAICCGQLSIPEVALAHNISAEELQRWLDLFRSRGGHALSHADIMRNRGARAA